MVHIYLGMLSSRCWNTCSKVKVVDRNNLGYARGSPRNDRRELGLVFPAFVKVLGEKEASFESILTKFSSVPAASLDSWPIRSACKASSRTLSLWPWGCPSHPCWHFSCPSHQHFYLVAWGAPASLGQSIQLHPEIRNARVVFLPTRDQSVHRMPRNPLLTFPRLVINSANVRDTHLIFNLDCSTTCFC